MNVLIALLSCEKDRPYMEAQLEGCFSNLESEYDGVGLDVRFFVGCTPTHQQEVNVCCEDDYLSLPFKTQEMCRWALAKGFDWMFKADTDTLIYVPRLMRAIPSDVDYSGYYRGHPSEPSYASGGSGYWLSARAMKIVVGATFKSDYIVENRGASFGEDLQVGKCLAEAGIFCKWDERYRLDEHVAHYGNDVITCHDVRAPLKGKAMKNAWARVQAGMRGGAR